jgi:flagellar biogenesis protein FliO
MHVAGQAVVMLTIMIVILAMVLLAMWELRQIVRFAREIRGERHDYFQDYEELEDANRTRVLRRR